LGDLNGIKGGEVGRAFLFERDGRERSTEEKKTLVGKSEKGGNVKKVD